MGSNTQYDYETAKYNVFNWSTQNTNISAFTWSEHHEQKLTPTRTRIIEKWSPRRYISDNHRLDLMAKMCRFTSMTLIMSRWLHILLDSLVHKICSIKALNQHKGEYECECKCGIYSLDHLCMKFVQPRLSTNTREECVCGCICGSYCHCTKTIQSDNQSSRS